MLGSSGPRRTAEEGVEDRLELRGDRRGRGTAGAGRGGLLAGAGEVEWQRELLRD
ncbi:hypothetical protein GCM10023080_038790 [Streptomyces pseudoechinosporeus]